jgi:hypothetical protein
MSYENNNTKKGAPVIIIVIIIIVIGNCVSIFNRPSILRTGKSFILSLGKFSINLGIILICLHFMPSFCFLFDKKL